MKRKRVSKADLEAQAAELVRLRGERTHEEWEQLLGVPTRTYIRYEQGQRRAPDVVMKMARVAGRKRGA